MHVGIETGARGVVTKLPERNVIFLSFPKEIRDMIFAWVKNVNCRAVCQQFARESSGSIHQQM